MTGPPPLRVVLVGPPLAASGGIGRVMSYALAELGDDVECRVLDTRGFGTSPWTSIAPLVRSCATLLWLGLSRKVDVVHVNISSHGSAVRKGLVVRICRLAGLPVLLHLHASSFPQFFDPLPAWLQRWVQRTFQLASRVVVLGEFWRRYAEDVLMVQADRVVVLPNATKAPVTAAGPPTRDGRPHILFLGRLGPRKGVPELLGALADPRLHDSAWRATLAGDGGVDAYRSEAAALGLGERIAFPGWVDAESVQDLLRSADLLVLPSRAEGMPIAVLEAFAAGVPVLCTPVGSIPETVVDGVNGLIVPVGDVAALAAALSRLTKDETLRTRLGSAARETWESHHSIERYADRLTEQWTTTAQRAPRHPVARVLTRVRG